ncbi:hypothetical protein K505DRAFT_27852 [Melanomma pulvis-pyrius CBS 109.77]|uniref:Mediator of RNA polymerase II transcription subunit 20 n=1 Tax=Melanomma pulvis-pyrius CBS 109.77 TaxID=1314802 RepID=A0A6A6XDL9_9PLEO|nr:hypothetical protein K505DRAFT_27852 [Melanomma pulvis-pyrius CBS 109.77]
MRYSGLYFVPIHGATQDASANILAAIINGIESQFEFATRQSPWTLFHRLLRSVPAPNAPVQPQTYQHLLHVSYLGNAKTYCYIHPFTPPSQTPAVKLESSLQASSIKPEPTSQAGTPQPSQSSHTTPTTPSSYGTIISIPAYQAESHLGYLVHQLSPLWALRHALTIPQGITYMAGQYIFSIGEIRMARSGPSSSSNLVSPGVVVCITTVAGAKTGDEDDIARADSGYASLDSSAEDEDSIDFEEVQAEIRAAWTAIKTGIDFGKADVREVMMRKDATKEEAEKEAVVRMWCEILRLRG